MSYEWDLFISHASEDKDFVRPLEENLTINNKIDQLKEMTIQIISNYQKKSDSLEEVKKNNPSKSF